MIYESPTAESIVGQPTFDIPGSMQLSSKQWLRLRFCLAMLLCDTAILFLSVAAADMIRFGAVLSPPAVTTLGMILPLYLAIGLFKGNYSSGMLADGEGSAVRALASLMLAAGSALFVAFCLHAGTALSRQIFGMSVVFGSVSLVLSRLAVQRSRGSLARAATMTELVIRDGVHMDTAGVASVDAAMLGLDPDNCTPHMLDRLGRLVQPVDRVIVACSEDRRSAWAMALKGAHVNAELLTPEMNELGTLGCGRFNGASTLVVSSGPLGMHSRAVKRALDLTLSVALLLFLAPLLIVTAFAIRLDSPGPILFVQPRLGRGNRLFSMYKFRSMRADQCDLEGRTSTARGDKRITAVGRVIRATSIDELPQLLNVLKGDMSFVGPRPHALGSLAEEKLFWEIDSRYWHRHAIKPGITGLAQIRGFRGATHQTSDLLDRLQSDLDYLNGWSIRRDLMILLATAKVVLHKNAY
jgi:exopolysaccharide biosynthesis polyprenyl glycosylphosphotransferase